MNEMPIDVNYGHNVCAEDQSDGIYGVADDVLSDEKTSLVSDLRYCRQLFEFMQNYRKFLLNITKKCKCGQSLLLKTNVDLLEQQFSAVYDNQRLVAITEKIANQLTDDAIGVDMSTLDQMADNRRLDDCLKRCVRRKRTVDELRGRKGAKTQRIVRKNLNNRELLNGLKEKTFVEVVDEENELISVIRTKEKLKSDEDFEFGSIVGFKCNVENCLFVTYRKDLMRGHLFGKHSNERPFSCGDCEKTFTAKKYLDSHKTTVHEREDNHKLHCLYPNCQYRTQFNSQMTIHMNRHKQDRAFRCDHCPSAFCSKGDLNVHKKLVHDGSRPYQCCWPGCGSTFKTVSAYNQHKAVHSSDRSFVCDYEECLKSFTNKERLKRHQECHQLVKRHRCYWPSCDRSFSRKYHLISHMKRHSMDTKSIE